MGIEPNTTAAFDPTDIYDWKRQRVGQVFEDGIYYSANQSQSDSIVQSPKNVNNQTNSIYNESSRQQNTTTVINQVIQNLAADAKNESRTEKIEDVVMQETFDKPPEKIASNLPLVYSPEHIEKEHKRILEQPIIFPLTTTRGNKPIDSTKILEYQEQVVDLLDELQTQIQNANTNKKLAELKKFQQIHAKLEKAGLAYISVDEDTEFWDTMLGDFTYSKAIYNADSLVTDGLNIVKVISYGTVKGIKGFVDTVSTVITGEDLLPELPYELSDLVKESGRDMLIRVRRVHQFAKMAYNACHAAALMFDIPAEWADYAYEEKFYNKYVELYPAKSEAEQKLYELILKNVTQPFTYSLPGAAWVALEKRDQYIKTQKRTPNPEFDYIRTLRSNYMLQSDDKKNSTRLMELANQRYGELKNMTRQERQSYFKELDKKNQLMLSGNQDKQGSQVALFGIERPLNEMTNQELFDYLSKKHPDLNPNIIKGVSGPHRTTYVKTEKGQHSIRLNVVKANLREFMRVLQEMGLDESVALVLEEEKDFARTDLERAIRTLNYMAKMFNLISQLGSTAADYASQIGEAFMVVIDWVQSHPYSTMGILLGGAITLLSLSYLIPFYVAMLPEKAFRYISYLGWRLGTSTLNILFNFLLMLFLAQMNRKKVLPGLYRWLMRAAAKQSLFLQTMILMRASGQYKHTADIQMHALEDMISTGARIGFNQQIMDLLTTNYVKLGEELSKSKYESNLPLRTRFFLAGDDLITMQQNVDQGEEVKREMDLKMYKAFRERKQIQESLDKLKEERSKKAVQIFTKAIAQNYKEKFDLLLQRSALTQEQRQDFIDGQISRMEQEGYFKGMDPEVVAEEEKKQ